MPEFEIQLRDVLIYANHGVMSEEAVTGNQYRVNVRLRISAFADPEDDDLSSTVSYADVYELLSKNMNRRARLLETVALRFAQDVRDKWPAVKSGVIEIVKTVPPIPGMIGEAGIKLEF